MALSRAVMQFSRRSWVQYIRGKTKPLFTRYLLLTNVAISFTLSGTGDTLQQHYEILCNRQKSWNLVRTRNNCLYSFFIGPACHYWYIFLDRALPGRTLMVVVKKILWDQIIMSPVSIYSYLLIIGFLRGSDKATVINDMKKKGLLLLKVEWGVWPPAQLINFYFLPTRYRVLYDNTVSLCFDYYYSYIMYRKHQEDHKDVNSEKQETGDKVCDNKDSSRTP